MGASKREGDEGSFDGVLDNIRRDAERILRGVEAFDPEGMMARLERDSRELDQLASREADSAARWAQERAIESKDFAAVIDCVIKRLIMCDGSYVLLRTDLAADLPAVAGDGRAVARLAERSLRTAILHAGDGGYVNVITRVEDGSVVFELTAEPGFEGSEAEITVPDPGLEDLADEVGGALIMGLDHQQVLHLAVTMAPASVF